MKAFSLCLRFSGGRPSSRLVFGQHLNKAQEHSAISIAEPEPQLSQSFKRRCIHRLFGLCLLPNGWLGWIGQQLLQLQPDDMSNEAEFFYYWAQSHRSPIE